MIYRTIGAKAKAAKQHQLELFPEHQDNQLEFTSLETSNPPTTPGSSPESSF